MPALRNSDLLSSKMMCIFGIIYILFIFAVLTYFASPVQFVPLFSIKFKTIPLKNNYTNIRQVFLLNKRLLNLTFSPNRVYHHDGVAYDYYSKNDLNRLEASDQWKIWPLPTEIDPVENNPSVNDIEISPFVISKLPFVDKIYATTGRHLTERQKNLRKAFAHQGIPIESIEWRWKWNRTTCNSNSSRSYVYQRLNFKNNPLKRSDQERCAILMEHVDIWYEIAEQKVPLALILEDDAIFVPFFKEKFTRMIYAAFNNGILRINGTCVKPKRKKMLQNEWIHQNAMITIGICGGCYGQYFPRNSSNATPLFSAKKIDRARCSHAYLLTSCSAQDLIVQMQAQKRYFQPIDHMQVSLISSSPTLQTFWVDPPLAYQGSKVIDMDKLSSLKGRSYEKIK